LKENNRRRGRRRYILALSLSSDSPQTFPLDHLENMCNKSSVLFEYDPAKSRSNLRKHGIDFEAVQQMWSGLVVGGPARSSGEDRMIAIGQIDGRYWTAIVTWRGPALRIVSARRSRQNEIQIHQDNSR
jgi:uncharacterized DUF497 family protein